MSNLQMIEELCGIAELQSQIIKKQAAALAQLDAVVCAEEIGVAEKRRAALVGDGGI